MLAAHRFRRTARRPGMRDRASQTARIIDLPPKGGIRVCVHIDRSCHSLRLAVREGRAHLGAGDSGGSVQATLLTLAIAAILALLAALFGPYFIDWNAHRATFEQQASQAIGLPVRVTGPMDVRLLPSPTLVLSGVEIGDAGRRAGLARQGAGHRVRAAATAVRQVPGGGIAVDRARNPGVADPGRARLASECARGREYRDAVDRQVRGRGCQPAVHRCGERRPPPP